MKKLKVLPPKWPLMILGWFCKPYYLEIIEGDLIEIFERDLSNNFKFAKLKFIWSIVCFFRIRYIKNLEDFKPKSSIGMFKNYFKVSLRSMRKNSSYAALNILGLSIGLSSCLLLLSHIFYQLTFDKHVENNDRIYRLVNDRGSSGAFSPHTPAPLVQHMLLEFPEFESGTRIFGPYDITLKRDNQFVKQDNVMSADSTFFDVFTTKFIHGEAKSALNAPYSIVITDAIARKFFKEENPVGKTLQFEEDVYQITAVVENQAKNSTIPYEVIVSLPHDKWLSSGNWSGNNLYSYLKLKPNVDIQELKDKFPEFAQKYLSAGLIQFMPEFDSWEDFLSAGNYRSYELVPLLEIHLNHPRLTLNKPGSMDNIYTFSIIAFFILVIACVNYINMSTSRSSLRSKEIGMRKVLGSVRKNIIQQFLLESVFMAFVSVIIGVLVAILVLPYFNILTDMSYTWQDMINLKVLSWILTLGIVIGLVAGSYPAFYLSSFSPVLALHGRVGKGSGGRLRTAMVIFQFAVSVFLITLTFIVFNQVSHVSNRNLGIDSEQIFVIRNNDQLKNNYRPFINELLSNSQIESVGSMNNYPSGRISDWSYTVIGDNSLTLNPDNIFTDELALQTLGLELIQGDFFKGLTTDSLAVIVNESFVKEAGWENPIGQMVSRGKQTRYKVIGVVKDFILRNGQYNTREVIFRYSSTGEGEGSRNFIHVKTSGDYLESLELIENAWNEYVPGFPFDGFFLNESFNRLYNSERRFGQMFIAFSGLAILIASIGLFSLAAFSLERRTKEIAIRKVLGSTSSKVITHIIFGFIKLIIIGSMMAAIPIYYFGNEWLNGFDYRITIDIYTFLIPIVLLSLISIGIVSVKTYRTATDNPVNALKAE